MATDPIPFDGSTLMRPTDMPLDVLLAELQRRYPTYVLVLADKAAPGRTAGVTTHTHAASGIDADALGLIETAKAMLLHRLTASFVQNDLPVLKKG